MRDWRRHGFRALLVAWILSLSFACRTSDRPKARNAILISLDTLRADHLGCYGYHRETSPHIDALAREGILFDRAIAQATSTLPSHRSLFQSKPASETRKFALTFARVLQRTGFQTAAFTGGGNVAGKLGLSSGFDVYEEYPGGLADGLPQMESWLRKNGSSPFLVFLHTYDIHLPYDPPSPYDSLFYPQYEGPISGSDTRDVLRKIRGLPSKVGDLSLTEEDRQKIVALYDGGIRYADEYIGRLSDLLEELGLAENTALVLLADHGEEFWDHGSVIHAHTLYEEQIRVPLIWRLPQNEFAGLHVEGVVRLLDVAPTVLELLGVDTPPQFYGDSLLPMMRGEEEGSRKALSEIRLLKTWTAFPWKIHTDGTTGEARLFNLELDPREEIDLSEGHREVMQSLRTELRDYLGGDSTTDVLERDPEIQDEDLLDQLRALGYIQ